jgi:hypothetical protein
LHFRAVRAIGDHGLSICSVDPNTDISMVPVTRTSKESCDP